MDYLTVIPLEEVSISVVVSISVDVMVEVSISVTVDNVVRLVVVSFFVNVVLSLSAFDFRRVRKC